MTLAVVCPGNVTFVLTPEEIACSRFLFDITGDLQVVTTIALDDVDPTIMGEIHRYMNCVVNPPGPKWIESFLEDAEEILCPLLQAALFLGISQLSDAISELISNQIQQCRTLEEVCFVSYSSSEIPSESSMIYRRLRRKPRLPKFHGPWINIWAVSGPLFGQAEICPHRVSYVVFSFSA
jgi:hypothetical protein